MYVNNYLMYLRKSRAEQDESIEQVLAKHYDILQSFAEEKLGGYIHEDNIYREVVSGETINERPQIKQVLKRIEDSNIAGVLVVDPQRLTRGDLIDCGTIINAFKYSSTKIITPTKSFDLSYDNYPNYDEKILKMELTSGSEYLEYSKLIMKRGTNLSRQKGNYVGSVAPYGYKTVFIDKSPTLDIVENEAEAVKLIYNKYIDGCGCTKIGNMLDEYGYKPRKSSHWSPSAIKDILINPVYCGQIAIDRRKEVKILKDGKMIKTRPRQKNYKVVKGRHPAIISQETFNKAQQKINSHPKNNVNKKLVNPLSSLIYCKNCGRGIVYRRYYKNGVQRCQPRYLCQDQSHCHTKSSRAEDLFNILIESLNEIIEQFEFKANNQNNEDVINNYNLMIKKTKKELEDIEIKQNELYDLLESKIYTREIFLKRNDNLDIIRKQVQKRLSILLQNSTIKTDYKEKALQFKDVLKALTDEEIEAEYKNILLKQIIDRIEYDNIDGKIILDIKIK